MGGNWRELTEIRDQWWTLILSFVQNKYDNLVNPDNKPEQQTEACLIKNRHVVISEQYQKETQLTKVAHSRIINYVCSPQNLTAAHAQ
jgi:hypothetical protein